MVRPPSRLVNPAVSPTPAVPSVIAMMRDGRLGRQRDPHHRRVHVHTVADNLGADVVVLEHRAREPGCAMADRRHAIEQMRRLTRARGDALETPARNVAPE